MAPRCVLLDKSHASPEGGVGNKNYYLLEMSIQDEEVRECLTVGYADGETDDEEELNPARGISIARAGWTSQWMEGNQVAETSTMDA